LVALGRVATELDESAAGLWTNEYEILLGDIDIMRAQADHWDIEWAMAVWDGHNACIENARTPQESPAHYRSPASAAGVGIQRAALRSMSMTIDEAAEYCGVVPEGGWPPVLFRADPRSPIDGGRATTLLCAMRGAPWREGARYPCQAMHEAHVRD